MELVLRGRDGARDRGSQRRDPHPAVTARVVAGAPYTGHCMCGGEPLEGTEEPLSAGYCHCTRCQRRTGTAASAQARIAPGLLCLLAAGEPVGDEAPEVAWPKCSS